MGKKQPQEERKLDLAAPDQDELEKRVKEMLEVEEKPKEQKSEEPQKSATKIEISHHTDDEEAPATAPELPGDEVEAKEETIKEDPDEPAKTEDPELQQAEKLVNLDEAPTDKAIIDKVETKQPDEESDEIDELMPDEPILEDESISSGETEKKEAEEPEVEKLPIDEVLEDSSTAKAVDEIIAKEGDELLEIQDQKHADRKETKSKAGIGSRIKGFFKAWWNNPKARWATIITLIVVAVLLAVLPTTRYFVLNTVGFRGTAQITVLDESTSQPLKNVNVRLANVEVKTDTNGQAELSKVKLGSAQLTVQKRAFAENQQKVTVSFGKNKLADVRLKPTGVQYSFAVNDFLSGKPIEKVEAVSGDASALSDQNGKIKLTVEGGQDKDSLEVSFQKDDYRKDTATINADDKAEQVITLVPGRRHVFVSKRTGTYDVYAIDVDGKNEKKLLQGTGTERDDIALSVHPTASAAALVSTRDGTKNGDGFLLSTLTVINDAGKTKAVTTTERVQLVDWIGDNLIYVQAVSGTSAGNPKRHRLVSYNYKTEQSRELAASNYFNDVLVFNEKIYIAPSSANTTTPAVLFRISAEGTDKVTILNQEVWNVFRTDYENLALSANKSWFNVRGGEDKATALSAQPTNPISRTYTVSKDGKNALWVDQRDGKGVLLNYEVASRNEQNLRSESGIKNPVYWLNNRVIVYRVSNEAETADYVLSLDGGDPKKIGDVTNTNSVDQWYYY